MANTTVHIINHTHWDREWFLTSVYTTQWIPGLIDRLEEIVAENPSFHYLLDGQTLIIEDLLLLRPEYEEKIARLVSAGNLLIGPYYCQPDWQLTSGESLMRNLAYGQEIMGQFGGKTDIGWMVDTFGHVSQSPQIHRKHGIDTVYVWRGVPQLKPYFEWQGANKDTLFAIDLFGGYRNLYGVTHAPDIAEIRLEKESGRLQPYYPTADVPLFDGYDLEDNPEDPVRWLQQRGQIPQHLDIVEATPMSFAETMREKLNGIPQICGELNSGKFGATFPGTFSSRAYLKLLGHDCEHMLYHVVEPLAALATLKGGDWAADRFKRWSKMILQNAVHDAICGVSIDQVHEKMDFSYRQIFAEMTAEIEATLPTVCAGFAPGRYAVNTSPMPIEKWIIHEDEAILVESSGLGVSAVAAGNAVTRLNVSVPSFRWENDHYQADLSEKGMLSVDGNQLGEIRIAKEGGDTYSDETGDLLTTFEPDGDLVIEMSGEQIAVVSVHGGCQWDGGHLDATLRYTFDPSPLVGIEIEVDSRGTDFHAELILQSDIAGGTIWAGMPFDRVERPFVDDNLLPRELDSDLNDIMMGQRELNYMRTFPMHNFVGVVGEQKSAVVFSRGNRAYRSWENGEVAISLRRSVEWVTEANLANRIGDAGPFFYVPDARCERRVTHELALYVGEARPDQDAFNRIEASFMHTPLLVDISSAGSQTAWSVAQSDQPVSAVWAEDGALMGRVWQASGVDRGGIEERPLTDGLSVGSSSSISMEEAATCEILNLPRVRSGENEGRPDAAIVEQLRIKAKTLDGKVADAQARLAAAEGNEKLKIEHELYIHDRERHEFLLSICLNELKIAQDGELSVEYLYEPHPDVTDIGHRLNQLRIKRRIFDYVATVI